MGNQNNSKKSLSKTERTKINPTESLTSMKRSQVLERIIKKYENEERDKERRVSRESN